MKRPLDTDGRIHRDLQAAQDRFKLAIDQIERLRDKERARATLALCISLETAIRGVVLSIRDYYDTTYGQET